MVLICFVACVGRVFCFGVLIFVPLEALRDFMKTASKVGVDGETPKKAFRRGYRARHRHNRFWRNLRPELMDQLIVVWRGELWRAV